MYLQLPSNNQKRFLFYEKKIIWHTNQLYEAKTYLYFQKIHRNKSRQTKLGHI